MADLEPGPVAVVAASGGVNHTLAFALAEAGVGLRLGVGLGNSLDVTQADVLLHLAEDEDVGAVALHVETAAEGRRLTEAVRRLTDRVPVVALVVGRSDIGDFARSQTGALATSWRVTKAALRQAGAVLVDDERDLVDAVTALSRVRLPPHPRQRCDRVRRRGGRADDVAVMLPPSRRESKLLCRPSGGTRETAPGTAVTVPCPDRRTSNGKCPPPGGRPHASSRTSCRWVSLCADQAEHVEHRPEGQREQIGVIGASRRLTRDYTSPHVVCVANGSPKSGSGRHSPSQTPSTANFWYRCG
ncbi:hypothetical protein [Streptomyces europaeiscabiei]|uniref:hypothetical protein n=1 Tax=Streptomyces europaeiscabiei TaxID=146819 RepID=UPI0029A3316C|nr:hypothetical protein [Streptomyces europaeiscabiei]MDX3836216.1 hypothetical protein [Streptomyces europaeiscabiei]